MQTISDQQRLDSYIVKHNIENILDQDIVQYAQLHFYHKDQFIVKAASDLQYYYLLVDGKVKISYLFENGKSMFLKFIKNLTTWGIWRF